MNLHVVPDHWPCALRYVCYDIVIRDFLPAGPDRALIQGCHEIISIGRALGAACQDFALAERAAADEHCACIEAARASQLVQLRRKIGDVARLIPKTSLGLLWKSDALIHVVEEFQTESVVEVVGLLRGYARDVLERFPGENAVEVQPEGDAAVFVSDPDLLRAIDRAEGCITAFADSTQAITLLPGLSLGEADALEQEACRRERELHESVDALQSASPKSPAAISALAQLVSRLVGEVDTDFQARSTSDVGRNLAYGVQRQLCGGLLSLERQLAS